jgi:hypothetical protein
MFPRTIGFIKRHKWNILTMIGMFCVTWFSVWLDGKYVQPYIGTVGEIPWSRAIELFEVVSGAQIIFIFGFGVLYMLPWNPVWEAFVGVLAFGTLFAYYALIIWVVKKVWRRFHK